MKRAITVERWLGFLESEYLDSFVRDGGSAVKFAVPMEPNLGPRLVDAFSRSAEERGFVTVRIDACETRVHMIDQIFFRLADAVPWSATSRAVTIRLASEAGYAVSGIEDGPLGDQIARLNRIDARVPLMELKRRIAAEILAQKSFAKDFRVAMTQLCLAQLEGGPGAQVTERVLLDWLTGRNPMIGSVKPYLIFNRINRGNARHALESMLAWLRFAGVPGMAATVNIARLALPRNPRDGQVYYTKASVLDAYEVFRQFLDGMDRMTGCLIIVIPDQSFLDEADVRGISAYAALKARVFDEVGDRKLANPMGSLVRLATA